MNKYEQHVHDTNYELYEVISKIIPITPRQLIFTNGIQSPPWNPWQELVTELDILTDSESRGDKYDYLIYEILVTNPYNVITSSLLRSSISSLSLNPIVTPIKSLQFRSYLRTFVATYPTLSYSLLKIHANIVLAVAGSHDGLIKDMISHIDEKGVVVGTTYRIQRLLNYSDNINTIDLLFAQAKLSDSDIKICLIEIDKSNNAVLLERLWKYSTPKDMFNKTIFDRLSGHTIKFISLVARANLIDIFKEIVALYEHDIDQLNMNSIFEECAAKDINAVKMCEYIMNNYELDDYILVRSLSKFSPEIVKLVIERYKFDRNKYEFLYDIIFNHRGDLIKMLWELNVDFAAPLQNQKMDVQYSSLLAILDNCNDELNAEMIKKYAVSMEELLYACVKTLFVRATEYLLRTNNYDMRQLMLANRLSTNDQISCLLYDEMNKLDKMPPTKLVFEMK